MKTPDFKDQPGPFRSLVRAWRRRPSDFFFRAAGTSILLAEGIGWVLGEKPDSGICIAAIGLFSVPEFRKKDDKR